MQITCNQYNSYPKKSLTSHFDLTILTTISAIDPPPPFLFVYNYLYWKDSFLVRIWINTIAIFVSLIYKTEVMYKKVNLCGK